MPLKLAIVGSRRFPTPNLVSDYVSAQPVGTVIVSGGAPGVDSVAEQTAIACGLDVLIFPADWENLGRKAGPIRNAQIVQAADQVVAFWDGRSRGTLNTVMMAHEMGKTVRVINSNGDDVPLPAILAAAEALGVVAAMAAALNHEPPRQK